jgi:hypothetical protein
MNDLQLSFHHEGTKEHQERVSGFGFGVLCVPGGEK